MVEKLKGLFRNNISFAPLNIFKQFYCNLNLLVVLFTKRCKRGVLQQRKSVIITIVEILNHGFKLSGTGF